MESPDILPSPRAMAAPARLPVAAETQTASLSARNAELVFGAEAVHVQSGPQEDPESEILAWTPCSQKSEALDVHSPRAGAAPQANTFGEEDMRSGEDVCVMMWGEDEEEVCPICLEAHEKDSSTSEPKAPTQACEVLCQKMNGDLIVVPFTERPLGMVTVANREPITVACVISGSHAENLGVQKGWVIRGINGVDVTSSLFPEVFGKLHLYSKDLPSPPVACLGCRRKYHSECLQNWVVKGSDTCPMCRQRKLPVGVERPSKEECRHLSGLPSTQSDAVTVPRVWSTEMDTSDCLWQDLFPHGFLFTCLCPCAVAQRIWHQANIDTSGGTNFGFVLMGVFFFLAMFCSCLLPYLGTPGDCTFPSQFVQASVQDACGLRQQVAIIGCRVCWLGFVVTLALHRHLLAKQFKVNDGCRALCCQCCGCYSCTLSQEARHVLREERHHTRSDGEIIRLSAVLEMHGTSLPRDAGAAPPAPPQVHMEAPGLDAFPQTSPRDETGENPAPEDMV